MTIIDDSCWFSMIYDHDIKWIMINKLIPQCLAKFWANINVEDDHHLTTWLCTPDTHTHNYIYIVTHVHACIYLLYTHN